MSKTKINHEELVKLAIERFHEQAILAALMQYCPRYEDLYGSGDDSYKLEFIP
jgi:hypothetical protein